MNSLELLRYRKKLIQDALEFRKGDRIPHLSNFVFWPIHHYGYKLTEACRNWDIMETIQRRFMEEFPFDQVRPLSGTLCNPPAMLDGIGEGFNIFDDEAGAVSIRDFRLLEAEEYEAFLEDKNRCEWERLLPRKFPAWNSLKVKDLISPIEEFIKFSAHSQKMTDVAREEFGIPQICSMLGGMPGVEQMFCVYVGMKGMSLDLRRRKETVKQICDMLEQNTDQVIRQIEADDPNEEKSAFTIMISILSQVFLNPKQWDEFYWPRLKKLLDAVCRSGKTAYIFVEGKIDRFYSYFKDFPAGHIAMHLEQDDIMEARRQLPDLCLVGGMPSSVLASAQPDECIQYAKKLIEELGTGGGYIISQDKMMSYYRDAKPENVKAVCNYLQEFYW